MTNKFSMDQVFIKKIEDILLVNLENEQFGVENLADELNLSRSQLHRKLNAINGKSTSQFIREYRLEKAMEMLQDNVATASEIAYRVGFSSPTYFNTSFNQYYGYPPGEVKFRNHSSSENEEGIQSSNNKASIITLQRKRFNQRTFLIVLLVIPLIATFSYYIFSAAKNTIATEIKEEVSTNVISIAVLPFKNWSGNPDLQYVCNGMTDAVISRLAKIKSITKIVPFTSVIKYNETDKSIIEIAKEQGVNNILQGSFQISGDQLKVTLQLINGLTNSQYWSAEYTGKWNSNEIFKVQAEVAENVAKEMNAEITDSEFNAIEKMPTKNIEAYNLFIQAEYKSDQLNKNAFKEAIPLYERAITLDPNFTEAYISFGEFWMLGGLIWGIVEEQQAWTKAKVLLERAYELDPTNYSITSFLNNGYFYYDWNFVAVENYLKKVNETEDSFESHLGFTDFYQKMGKFDKHLLSHENQIKKFPLDPWNYILNAWSLFLLDKKDQSHQLLASCEAMFTDDLNYLMESSRLYYYLGDYKSSKKQLDDLMNNFPDRPPLIIWLNAVLANVNGNSESQYYLNLLQEQYNTKVSGSPAWFIALYYAHIKDYNKTFEWLQKSYNRHEVEMTWLKEEPLLRPLRTDPRYIELYDKVGFSKISPITPYVD